MTDEFYTGSGTYQDILADVRQMELTMPRFLFRGFVGTQNGVSSRQGVYPYAFRPDQAPRNADGSMLNNRFRQYEAQAQKSLEV